MALKDLLVYLDQTARAPVRLRLAADLAGRHGSRLIALYVREWTQAQLAQRKTAELALRPPQDLQRLDIGVEVSIDHVAGELHAALQRLGAAHGLDVEWRCLDGQPLSVLPQQARCADLCILGEDTPTESTSAGYSFAEEMLFITGRPILFVPAAGEFATLGRHVLVAWNSSLPAARAINDALPLIERADKTTVLAINPADFIGRHGALPPQQLVDHLRRHGASAQQLHLENVPAGCIAATLQAKALELGADLIVAGAYGHARIREKLLGGVTRDLLTHMTLPLMMSL